MTPELPIHDSRTPHKMFLLVASVIAGVLGALAPHARGASIADAFPGWAQIVWYAGLAIGAAISLIGILKRGLTGALIEQAGMVILTGLVTSFAAAAFAHTGVAAISGALLILGFGVANAVRAWQIHQDIKTIRNHLAKREHMELIRNQLSEREQGDGHV